MRNILFVITGAFLLLGCANPEPISQDARVTRTWQFHASEVCVRKGYVNNMSAVAAYKEDARSAIWRGNVTQEQVDEAWNAVKNLPVSAADCREIEFYGTQILDAERERQRQMESFSRSMDSLQNSVDSMNASRPKTTYCQNYQWGGVVCNSY